MTFIDTFTATFHHVSSSVQENLSFLLTILAILWVMQFLNVAAGYRFNRLGIYPRRINGLFGIFISPFLHGSFAHLFLNSIPLFMLGALVLVGGKYLFFKVTFLIIAASGFVTWLWGRRAYHIGASSVILGYWGFLLFNGYLHRSSMTLFVALLCLYYFGGLIFSLFPQQERVSWEGHLAGFLSGILASYLLSV
jgi:membrane associated rhomboid family serine protease